MKIRFKTIKKLMRKIKKYDLHIHSKYSYDSVLEPKKILKIAKKRGLDGIAITDHNTIKGGLKVKHLNGDTYFHVIVGAEIKTEYGDIIGLFLNKEINSKNFIEVIEEIKSQGGLCVLPHPYRKLKIAEKSIHLVDCVEVFNARSLCCENKKAFELAKKFNKPMTAGSDAHLFFEIGRGITLFKGDIQKQFGQNKTHIYGKESNYLLVHGLSLTIEKIKSLIHFSN